MLRKLRILTVYSETQFKALPKALRTVKKNVEARGSLVAECMLHLRFNHKCVLEYMYGRRARFIQCSTNEQHL